MNEEIERDGGQSSRGVNTLEELRSDVRTIHSSFYRVIKTLEELRSDVRIIKANMESKAAALKVVEGFNILEEPRPIL